MRLKLLCCEILFREACHVIADSPHTVSVEFLPKGLHDLGNDKMVPRLQERIDAFDDGSFDAVLMGYGLCNNGTVGLFTRKSKLVIPRAHDCITLLMGSRDKYAKYFNDHPGAFYRSTGWVERDDATGAGDETVPQKLGLFMQYEKLVQQYGEENAKYVMETMGDSTPHYDRVTFISVGLDCEDAFRKKAEEEANEKGWEFEDYPGSMGIVRKLVFGEWDDDFLVLNPGQKIKASHDDGVVAAEDG